MLDLSLAGSLSESATAADFADPMLAFRALAAAQGGCDESARGSGPPVGSEGGVEGSREVAGAGAVGSAGGQGGAVATDDELDALD